MLDLVLRNGTIVDGSGSPPFTADIGIEDGSIAYVGRLDAGASAAQVIDVTGLHVVPGFIDIHSHSDFVVADPDHESILRCFLEQGITTLVTGNCGFAPAPIAPQHRAEMQAYTEFLRSPGTPVGWPTFGEYLDQLDEQHVALNLVPLAAHGALRIAAMGFEARATHDDEAAAMERGLAEALDAGAFGMSAGLAYAPGMYAPTEEIVRLAKLVAVREAIFTCHSRGLSETLTDAVAEVVTVARNAGTRTQFSHLCALGESNWPRIETAINQLELARRQGIDIATDCQAYIAGNTTLTAVLPPWALDGGIDAVVSLLGDKRGRQRIRRAVENDRPVWPTPVGGWTDNMIASLGYDNIWLLSVGADEFTKFEGMSLADMARRREQDPFDATMDLIISDRGRSMMLVVGSAGSLRSDAPLRSVLSLPYTAIETDAIVTGMGKPNRGAYGAYPRMLGHFVRDEGLVPLEQAVHQMTGLAADRLGLTKIGRLQPGCAGDVVVVDMHSIADTTTYLDTEEPPAGIVHVFVNGHSVVDGGRYQPARHGVVYRHQRP